jgi:hypothetical protein
VYVESDILFAPVRGSGWLKPDAKAVVEAEEGHTSIIAHRVIVAFYNSNIVDYNISITIIISNILKSACSAGGTRTGIPHRGGVH